MSKNPYTGQDDGDNAGQVSIGTDGDLNIGLGGGLAIDPTNGDLGINVGGITIDF